MAFVGGAAAVLLPWAAGGIVLLSAWRAIPGRYPLPLLMAAGFVAMAGLGTQPIDIGTVAFLVILGALVASGAAVAWIADEDRIGRAVFGLVAGLGVAAAVSVVQVLGSDGWGLPARAYGWWPHANVWGASVLIPTLYASSLSIVRQRKYLALASVVFGLTVVLASGSRSALLALLVGLGLMGIVVWRRAPAFGRVVGAVAIVTVAALTIGVFGLESGWRQRVAGTFGLAERGAVVDKTNLFQASEDLRDGVWWAPAVEVERRTEAHPGSAAVHHLRRTGDRWTDRVQQRVPLDPDVVYTFSAEVRGPPEPQLDPVPALVVWADTGDGVFEVVVRLPRSGAPAGYANGVAELRTMRSAPMDDGFVRIEVSFESRAIGTTHVQAGIAPRSVASGAASAGIEVRRVQMQVGDATAYAPTQAPDRRTATAASSIATRFGLYRDLAPRIAERPWTGWGSSAFAVFATEGGALAVGGARHEHSLVLWFLHRYGALGLLAYGLVLWGLGGRSLHAWSLVLVVVVANLADVTFLSDAVYVTAAVACGVARGRTDRPLARTPRRDVQGEESRRR